MVSQLEIKKHLHAFQLPEVPGVEERFGVLLVETLDVFAVEREAYEALSENPEQTHALFQSTSFCEDIQALIEIGKAAEQRRLTPDAFDQDFGIEKLALNINQICNLRCDYCYAHGDGTYGRPAPTIDKKLAEAAVRLLLENARGTHLHLKLFGGEPLLSWPACLHLLHYATKLASAQKKTVRFELNTNGTLLTEEIVKAFAPFPIEWRVSLDGPEEIHDQHRKDSLGQGTFSRVLYGLSLLKRHDQLARTRINCVVHEGSGEIARLWDFMKQFLPAKINFSPVMPVGTVGSSAHTVDHAPDADTPLPSTVETFLSILASQRPLKRHCEAGRGLRAVDSHGDVYPCFRFVGLRDFKMGHLTEKNTVTTGADFQPDHLAVQRDCQTCWARTLCGGGCLAAHYNATGNMRQPDPLSFCRHQKAMSEIALTTYLRRKLSEENNRQQAV